MQVKFDNAGLCWRNMEVLAEVGRLRHYLDACKANDAATERMARECGVRTKRARKRRAAPVTAVSPEAQALLAAALKESEAVAERAPRVDLYALLKDL